MTIILASVQPGPEGNTELTSYGVMGEHSYVRWLYTIWGALLESDGKGIRLQAYYSFHNILFKLCLVRFRFLDSHRS